MDAREARLTATAASDECGRSSIASPVLREEIKGRLADGWRTRISERVQELSASMLDELLYMGFAWHDLARMLHVSVYTAHRWRSEKETGDRRRLASLLAVCDIVIEEVKAEEAASWFETSLVPGIPISPIELFANDRFDLLFDFLGGQSDPEALLTEFDPDWLPRYSSDFEVFEAQDGNYSLHLKG